MYKKSIYIEVQSPGLTNYKGMAEIRNIELIEMVKLMFQHTMLPISFWSYTLQIGLYLSIIEMVKLMFQHTTFPISFWGYALQIGSYLSNLVVYNTSKMTTFRHWFRTKHDLDHLCIRGSQVIINKVNNLGVKEERGLLVGYNLEKKEHKVYCTQR